MSRLRVTTKSGSIYMIDMDTQTAARLRGDEAQHLITDGELFHWTHLYAVDGLAEGDEVSIALIITRAAVADIREPRVGQRMLFLLGSGDLDWQLTTAVASITEVGKLAGLGHMESE